MWYLGGGAGLNDLDMPPASLLPLSRGRKAPLSTPGVTHCRGQSIWEKGSVPSPQGVPGRRMGPIREAWYECCGDVKGSGTAAPAADTASSCGHFVLATVDSAIHTGEAQLNASG